MNKIIFYLLFLFLAFIAAGNPNKANAMTFKIFYQPDMQLNIVVAEGEIVDGDALKFLEISKKADRDEKGDIVLVLNSLGGSVPAAFKLADVISEVGVFTLVPDDALCASACASILYTSGNRRNIIGNGRLGFHTCYHTDGKNVESSSFCNEAIANHAISNGLAHASVSLFVNEYDAGEMAWVGADVACTMLFGMCRTSLDPKDIEKEHDENLNFLMEVFEEFHKKTPSFDCEKAETSQEKMICENSDLAELDSKMADLYKVLLSRTTESKVIIESQRSWLRNSRNLCKNEDCLLKSYHNRISELEALSK